MNEHNQKHLTLSDRTYIEQELLQKSTFTSIGRNLHKNPTTIAKEVKRYYKTVSEKYNYKCNLCKHFQQCNLMSKELKCSSYNPRYCSFYCKKCYRKRVIDFCPYFLPYTCDKVTKPPYVCNYCEDYKHCPIDKKIYEAAYAQKQYEKKLYDSRKGINMTPEELQELNDLISPLILKKEETNRRTYHSLHELQLSVFEYIEGFYNSKRPHGSLGMMTPNEKEDMYWEQT